MIRLAVRYFVAATPLALLMMPINGAGAGGYRLSQTLIGSDSEPNDRFGAVVDIDGGTAIVRSRAGVDSQIGFAASQTHVFVLQGNRWREEELYFHPYPANAGLGISIGEEAALADGDVVVANAVALLDRDGEGLFGVDFPRASPNAVVLPPSGFLDGYLARSGIRSVALSEGTALIGDLGATHSDGDGVGVVHIVEKNVSGEWVWSGLLQPNVALNGGSYGINVEINGSDATVSERWAQDLFGTATVTYFFERGANGQWEQNGQVEFPAFGSLGGSEFGDVGFSVIPTVELGDGFAIGRGGFGSSAAAGEEGAVVFLKAVTPGGETSWQAVSRFLLRDPETFGPYAEVAVEGDLVAMTIGTDAGNAVNLYRHLGGGKFRLLQTITSPESAYTDYFGASLAISGSRLLIGATPFDAIDAPIAGKVFVFQIPEPASALLLLGVSLFIANQRRRRARSGC